MKVLIVGLGSIARKHINALRQIEPHAEIFAMRSGTRADEKGITNLYTWDQLPEDLRFAMVCNPTSEHFSVIQRLLTLNIPLFIEKPPFFHLNGVDEILKKIKNEGIKTYTAFNFRFHPVIKWLKSNLGQKRVIEVQAYCGSYLPDWRPGRDYKDIYSAKANMGGGVHLDLIHELDYLFWIFGKPDEIKSDYAKISDLEIDSYDIARYWMTYKNLKVSVILNYYRRDAKRQLEIVFDDETWFADLLHSSVIKSDGSTLFTDNGTIIDTYVSQLRYFLEGLDSEPDYMNNLFESSELLKHILE